MREVTCIALKFIKKHEMSHASIYSKVGINWYQNFVTAELIESIIHSTKNAPWIRMEMLILPMRPLLHWGRPGRTTWGIFWLISDMGYMLTVSTKVASNINIVLIYLIIRILMFWNIMFLPIPLIHFIGFQKD
ncbi:hypothetical protein EFY79_16965 [Hanamia caeni]|uniref:Uncharacterized protein n=1 Tax=Hanamia caeni TaxID=2294116 RepID=A0A3M9N8D6_9BACT|nr:hypothetical protein EFY79_16965 [Hanamia caeni]